MGSAYQNIKSVDLTKEQLIEKLQTSLTNSHKNNDRLRRDVQGKDNSIQRLNQLVIAKDLALDKLVELIERICQNKVQDNIKLKEE